MSDRQYKDRIAKSCDQELAKLVKDCAGKMYEDLSAILCMPDGLDPEKCAGEIFADPRKRSDRKKSSESYRQWVCRWLKKRTFGERLKFLFCLIHYGEKERRRAPDQFQDFWPRLYGRTAIERLPGGQGPQNSPDGTCTVYEALEYHLFDQRNAQSLLAVRNEATHGESVHDITQEQFEHGKAQLMWALDLLGAEAGAKDRAAHILEDCGVWSNVPARSGPEFVGREEELEYLQKLLTDQETEWQNVVYTAVGGTGKTTLVLQALNQYIDAAAKMQNDELKIGMVVWCDFKDARLAEEARGKMVNREEGEYITTLRQLLELILRVGTGYVPGEDGEKLSISQLEQQTDSLLARYGRGRKVLLVLDNLETISDAWGEDGELTDRDKEGRTANSFRAIREYLERLCGSRSGGCVRLLGTSRRDHSLNGVSLATQRLSALSRAEGARLIRNIWPDRAELERQLAERGEACLEEVSQRLAGNPLYIIWSVKQGYQLQTLLDMEYGADGLNPGEFLRYLFERAYNGLPQVAQKTLYWIYLMNKSGKDLDRELFTILLGLDAQEQEEGTPADPDEVVDRLRERSMAWSEQTDVGEVLRMDPLVANYLEYNEQRPGGWQSIMEDFERLSGEFNAASGIREVLGLGRERDMAERYKLQCAFAQSSDLQFRKVWTGNKRISKGRIYTGSNTPLELANLMERSRQEDRPGDPDNPARFRQALNHLTDAYEGLSRVVCTIGGDEGTDVDICVCSVLMNMRGKLLELTYIGDGEEPWQDELRELLDRHPDWYQVCRQRFLSGRGTEKYAPAAYFLLASEEKRRYELNQKRSHWYNRDPAKKQLWIPPADRAYRDEAQRYGALYSAEDKLRKSVEALNKYNEGKISSQQMGAPVSLFPDYIDYQIKVIEANAEQEKPRFPEGDDRAQRKAAESKERDLAIILKSTENYLELPYQDERSRLRVCSGQVRLFRDLICNLSDKHITDDQAEKTARLDEDSIGYMEGMLSAARQVRRLWTEEFSGAALKRRTGAGYVDYKPMGETIHHLMKVTSMWGDSTRRLELNRDMLDLIIDWYLQIINSDRSGSEDGENEEGEARREETAFLQISRVPEDFLFLDDSNLDHTPLPEAFLLRSQCWSALGKRGRVSGEEGTRQAFLDYQRACTAKRRYLGNGKIPLQKRDKLEQRFERQRKELSEELDAIPFLAGLPVGVHLSAKPMEINDGLIYQLSDGTSARVHYDQLPGLAAAKEEWERLACPEVKGGRFYQQDREKWSARRATREVMEALHAADPDDCWGLEPVMKFALEIRPYVSFKSDEDRYAWEVRKPLEGLDTARLDKEFLKSFRQALRQSSGRTGPEGDGEELLLETPFGQVMSCFPAGSVRPGKIQIIRGDPDKGTLWRDTVLYDNAENAILDDGRRMMPYLDFTHKSVVRLQVIRRKKTDEDGTETTEEMARILGQATEEEAGAFQQLLDTLPKDGSEVSRPAPEKKEDAEESRPTAAKPEAAGAPGPAPEPEPEEKESSGPAPEGQRAFGVICNRSRSGALFVEVEHWSELGLSDKSIFVNFSDGQGGILKELWSSLSVGDRIEFTLRWMEVPQTGKWSWQAVSPRVVSQAAPAGPAAAGPRSEHGLTEGKRVTGSVSKVLSARTPDGIPRIFAWVDGARDEQGRGISIFVDVSGNASLGGQLREGSRLSFTLRYRPDRGLWNGADPAPV